MTATRDTPANTGQYRLATFGIPALTAVGGETVLGTHGNHRRRLALLTVLAVAGDRGYSRDQLLVLLWPDSTQSRARHSLDQLLYVLRGSLGESVFASVNPLRLNADTVTSDVATYTAAIERGDLLTAVDAYQGPFLDGFYLSDAPEFEQWAEGERARLAATYAKVLERLARKADNASDHVAGAQWWRKLAELDPLSSRYTASLVRALIKSGDQAAALRVVERYEVTVSRELGGDAPSASALVGEVRAAVTSIAPPTIALPAPAPNDVRPPARHTRWATPYVVGAIAVAVAALLAVVASVWTASRAGVVAEHRDPSIAVLPLANVDRNPKDEALADGLTEEIVGVLAQLRGVRVAARTSASAFKNSQADVRQIGDSLGVDYLLEGGVQKSGDRLRVQVRLVDTRTGTSRWSETYNRELRDIFEVQSDIAEAVARQLNTKLGGSALGAGRRIPTRNPAAYELYLRGNDPATTRGDSASRAGVAYFRQAIAIDPQYAAAYAGLARLLLARSNAGHDTAISRHDALAAAEAAARKAIALDSTLPEAHLALAGVRRSQTDFAGAEVEIERAIALDPTNPRPHEWLIQNYLSTGRPVEALAEARKTVALDPLSPNAIAELGHALLVNDRCDEALAELAKVRSLRPPLLRAGDYAAQCYIRKRMWPQAIAEVQRNGAAGGPAADALAGFIYARSGQPDRARTLLATLLDRARRTEGIAFHVATIYAGLGDKDQAFLWLDKAAEEGTLSVFDRLDLVFDALSPDPRVDAFRRRLNLQKR